MPPDKTKKKSLRDKTSALHVEGIDPELKAKLKAWCALHGSTIRNVVVDWMQKLTESNA